MKAILVTVSLTTRIIVPDEFDIDNLSNEDYATIREKAFPNYHNKLELDGVGDLLAEIEPDEEMPFGEGFDDENSKSLP